MTVDKNSYLSQEESDTRISTLVVNNFDDTYEGDEPTIEERELNAAVVTGADWTTETILNQINKGNINLDPNFQRRDAWDRRRKSDFIESLILGFPIPQIVLAEDREHRGRFIVLDGKQRLLAIKQFAAGSSFDPNNKTTERGFALSGLKVLKKLNGEALADIEEDPLKGRLLDSFQNQTIRTVMVRNWPNEDYLNEVFLRLNTGSVQLSPQELRQALHPGPFTTFLDDFSASCIPLQRSLGNKGPDFRMRDVELTLRFFAFDFFLPDYHGNLKHFLDEAAKDLNRLWFTEKDQIKERAEQLSEAIAATNKIFGSNAFRSWSQEKQDFQGRFNRAVFDVMIYYFKDPLTRDAAISRSEEVRAAFKHLAQRDQIFVDAITSTTKTTNAVVNRIGKWGNELRSLLPNLEITVPRLENDGITVV